MTQIRALQILQAIALSPRGLVAQEVAATVGAPRTTTYRLLDELVGDRWLIADGSPKRYVLGWLAVELGLAALRPNRVRQVMAVNALELCRFIRRDCQVAFYDAGEVVYTDMFEMRGERIVPIVMGQRFPASATACGKALLMHQSDAEIAAVAGRGSPRYTPQTKVEPDEIRRDIEHCRSLGYGFSYSEVSPASGAVACAVFDGSGQPVGALGIHVRGTDEQIAQCVEAARSFARSCSMELGWPGEVTFVA